MSEPENRTPPPGGDEPKTRRPLDAGDVIPLEKAVPPAAGPGPPPLPTAAAPQTASPPAPEPPPSAPVATPAAPAPARIVRAPRRSWLAERPEVTIEVPRRRLAAQSRRDFILFSAGLLATAAGAWWLLPDRTRARLTPGPAFDALDSLAKRAGFSRDRRERALDRALTFDDDVAEALFSSKRLVRTYRRSDITPLRNNYDGQTPDPDYIPMWRLSLSGLASGRTESFAIDRLLGRFPFHEQVTRLVCVEGWSAIAWWGGIRFADFLAAYPPAPGARWAALGSEVNLDGAGRPDPYYVSIDLETARHPQALLATHLNGRPLPVEHGAPMRLLVPMKLGLKNIKAVTDIEYTGAEPPDYWNERGYSRYDGL
jgi:DMSO/TMAO reductase YedYZ molybdopterin-dependent catalytic subunit